MKVVKLVFQNNHSNLFMTGIEILTLKEEDASIIVGCFGNLVTMATDKYVNNLLIFQLIQIKSDKTYQVWLQLNLKPHSYELLLLLLW